MASCVGAFVVAPAGAHDGPSNTTGHTTLEQTVCGRNTDEVIQNCGDPEDGFQTLTLGPGEGHLVREALAQAQAGREDRRISLSYFGQITDFQLADEESPAREERTDSEPFRTGLGSSGFRPHETMTAHMVELSIRQLNNFLQSPVTQGDGSRAQLQNALMTGDLADNAQLNETEWVLQLLTGTTDPDDPAEQLNPGSGTSNFTGTTCQGLPPSLVADGANPERYTGVQDYDDYLLDNPLYWDPEVPLGDYYADWPKYPGLLDRAQVPFEAEGLAVPTYVAFGNHDGYYQGTVNWGSPVGPGTHIPPTERVATDCVKFVYPFTDQEALGGALTPEYLQLLLASDPSKGMLVPPDPRRQAVNHMQFKDVFETGTQEDDHGFAYVEQAELSASSRTGDPEDGYAAYYSFRPDPDRPVRFIVLDTMADSGVLTAPNAEGGTSTGDDGNIDNPQWLWLQEELQEAEGADELVIAFGHHATGSLEVSVPDEVFPCTVNDQHGHDVNPSCDADPRNSFPTHLGTELAELFLDHPNVIAYVAGHSHQNQIQAFERGDGSGGFWEIKSPAIADWPPQHRVLELMDNKDGTLSIFTTNIDHEGSTDVPAGADDERAEPEAASDRNAAGFDVETLGSIGRTVEYNDPHVGPLESEIGLHQDRNTELLLFDPRDAGGAGGDPGGSGGGGAAGGKRCLGRRVTMLGTNQSEKIVGTPGNDVIKARKGRDRIHGKGGNDVICGGRGKDKLYGNKGRDILIGGDHFDYLNGGSGRNRLFGGTPKAPNRKATNVCVVGPKDRFNNCQVIR